MHRKNSITSVLFSILVVAILFLSSCGVSEQLASGGNASESSTGNLIPIENVSAADESATVQVGGLVSAGKSNQAIQKEPVSATAIEANGVRESSSGAVHDVVDHGDVASVERLQYTFNDVVGKVLPTVVEINVTSIEVRPAMTFNGWPWFFDSSPNNEEYESNSLGSGVIFRKDGNTYYILTNHHVAGDADSIEIVLDDGRKYEAELVGTDERRDLAVVSFKTAENDIPIASLGDSDQLAVGDWVLAMGSPFGYVSSVTAGIVSALGRSGRAIDNINDFIQTDAAINSGNSGGPLVNIYGEVIGINTWIAAPSGGSIGLGFAIPINNAKDIIDELIEYGRAVDGWLGISMLDTDTYASLLSKSESPDVEGVFVANIYLNSPAYKGGIRAGDIIVGFNDQEHIDIDLLSRDISNAPLGKEQTFKIYRDNKYYKAMVALEERKTDEEISKESDLLWPGILPIELNEEILSSLSLSSRQKGVMIQFMTTNSESNRFRNAGLMNYDIITKINGRAIETVNDFYRLISDDSIRDYTIQYVRNGKIYTTGVKK